MRYERGKRACGSGDCLVCMCACSHTHTHTRAVHIHILRHMHTKLRILEKANKRHMPYAVEMEW